MLIIQDNSGPEDRFVTVNGRRLHYVDWGGASNKYVLFIHGLMSNARDWDEVAANLNKVFRVLCIDLRGHGDSQWTREGYWPHLMASDIAGFVGKLGLNRFSLVGHSLGVWVAIAYAGDHWERLSHLVLCDFAPEVNVEPARVIRERAKRPAGFADVDRAMRWLQENYPSRPLNALRRRMDYGMQLNWAGVLVWKHDPEVQWITGKAGLTIRSYLWDQLTKIQCPTLVMRGDSSELLTREMQKRMVALLRAGQTAELAGVGHYLQDATKEFSEVLNRFLERKGTND